MTEFDRRESEERFREENPEEHMRRREFLLKTASLAGLAGLATVLPADTILSQAALLQSQASGLPSPSNMPIDTFVVLMMENRSFDHYLGWFPGADGKNNISYPDGNGGTRATHPLAPDFQGCAFKDPNHEWTGSREEYDNGRLDGFYTVNDDFAIGYYVEKDLPFIPAAARAFTLYDRYFASLLGPTFPNRHYMWSAQCGGQKSNIIPADTLGDKWETIFDRAIAQGLTARYYASDQPFAALYGERALPWIRHVSDYYADAAAGTLPNIAFVDPPFLDGGGGDGLSADEHPHGDIRLGQAFMSDVTNAFLTSPQFRRGAMFINYDEWGGFFDHVSPRFVPDDLASPDLNESFGITGFRIPGIALSPYARRGYVSHATVTHESILKLISYRFGLGYLNKRHRYASNIGYTFDWANPRFDPPVLPTALPPATISCTAQGAAPQSEQETGFGSPEWAEYLAKLGIEPQPARADTVFSSSGARTSDLADLWRNL